MKAEHLDYTIEDSHLAEIGLIGIAKYGYENHYAMVVEGERSSDRALLFFLPGKCVLSQRHQELLVLPNAFINPTVTAKTIIMNEPHAKPGAIIIDKNSVSILAIKEGDWNYVSLNDGTISSKHISFKPYTLNWHILRPDHSGILDVLYSFEPDPPVP